MGNRRRSAIVVVAVAGPLLLLTTCWLQRSSLPFIILPRGRVIDAETRNPIAGATLEYGWQIYDYPMLDGAGSQRVVASVTTDANGAFTLVVPDGVRRGLWSTEILPLIVRSDGYAPFTDESAVLNEDGLAIIPMIRKSDGE